MPTRGTSTPAVTVCHTNQIILHLRNLAKDACLSHASSSHKNHCTNSGRNCKACLLRATIRQVNIAESDSGCDLILFTATSASTFTLARLCPGTLPQLQRSAGSPFPAQPSCVPHTDWTLVLPAHSAQTVMSNLTHHQGGSHAMHNMTSLLPPHDFMTATDLCASRSSCLPPVLCARTA